MPAPGGNPTAPGGCHFAAAFFHYERDLAGFDISASGGTWQIGFWCQNLFTNTWPFSEGAFYLPITAEVDAIGQTLAQTPQPGSGSPDNVGFPPGALADGLYYRALTAFNPQQGPAD